MTTRFAKLEFQRGQADSAQGPKGQVLGRAEVALYDGPFVNDDVIDDIFCRRWCLPPPKLIISVTGSAQEWDTKCVPASAADRGAAAAAAPKQDATAGVASDDAEQAAIVRFIKNCVYASAVESRCCWIVSGGSNGGVMRLLGDARRLLGGWGDDVRLGSAQVPLIGVSVASKMKYYDSVLKKLRGDGGGDVIELQYQPGLFERCKEDLSRKQIDGKSENSYVPDPSHSHLLFLGSENGKWGDEVKQRMEAEEYLSSKFRTPVVYIVLGGGTVTLQLVQDCIRKQALTVVVKGSGRVADVIAEYAKNMIIHDEESKDSPLFWKLHGKDINERKKETDEEWLILRSYRLQECTAKYMSIVNSKYLAIFNPEDASYEDMCSRICAVTYAPSKHTFNPSILEKMRMQRPISQGLIAKNSGFEVQGFCLGAVLAPQQPLAASTPTVRHGRVTAAPEPNSPFAAVATPRPGVVSSGAYAPQLSDAFVAAPLVAATDARDDFTDMLVSMIRKHARHPDVPDVFVTLLLAQDNPENTDSLSVKSLIEGLAAASHACLIWSLLYLNRQLSHNVMQPLQKFRLNSRASLHSSVIAFSDSDMVHSAHFSQASQDKRKALRSAMKDCNRKPLHEGGGNIVMPEEVLADKRIMSGIDEVFFAENADFGERFDTEYRLKQHVALRLQVETHLSDVYRTCGVYVVCGGSLKQFISDLQWCSSQRSHLLVFADSGGLCTGLSHAISLHKYVLIVAEKLLQLCCRVAGMQYASRSDSVCSIEGTIATCLKVLEKIEHEKVPKDAYTELERIAKLLVPHQAPDDYMEGKYPGRVQEPENRMMRRKSLSIVHAMRVFAPNQVHPDSPRAPAAEAEPIPGAQHALLKTAVGLLLEHASQSKENAYVLLPSCGPKPEAPRVRQRSRAIDSQARKTEQDKPFVVTAKRVLANLKKLQWQAAVVEELRKMEQLMSSVSFEDSVLAMVNLVEKCRVTVVFDAALSVSGASRIDNSKLVAQCVRRRAIESPSAAMGHPAVDMFGETSLMFAVASGSMQCVTAALDAPGADIHYICRCSSHPTTFGMNALLVALMLQLPDAAEAIVDKMLQLLSNPHSTVFLSDDADQQQADDGSQPALKGSGIGNIKHSVKTVTITDYIGTYNASLVQGLLSSRHPESHITALMFACRWGYAHLLPKFFELVKLQERIKTSSSPGEGDGAQPVVTPFERHKKIALSLSLGGEKSKSHNSASGELAEAGYQSEFKMLLLGDHNCDFGVDVNGRSALHHAVSSGSSACVSCCMDLGADALRRNKKYTYRRGSDAAGPHSAGAAQGLEFQDDFEPEMRIYCGFSSEELRYLHETGEFEAYRMNVNPELGSVINCCMFRHCLDALQPKLRDMVQRDGVSSVALQRQVLLKREGVDVEPNVQLWFTESFAAFDVALFSWGIHGVYFDRKKLELELEQREQNFKMDVLVQQRDLLRLKTHRDLAQGCVEALEGTNSKTSNLESMASIDAGDVTFLSRGSLCVRESIRNKAYRRIIAPLMSSFVLIALLFLFCSLINTGMSPRETRAFVQTILRGVRDTYMDVADGSGVMRLRSLHDMPQFMARVLSFLAPRDDASVQRVGAVRVSFMFEQRRACTGWTAGLCASHYDDMVGYSSGAIDLAATTVDINDAATPQFMNFSSSIGAKFRTVSDCGNVYCFNAPAVQLLLPASSTFEPTWTALAALLPQLASLRFMQLGFVLYSPAIEQSIGVRLLVEVQETAADISVHDRFTSLRIAPDVPFWRLSSQPRGVLSIFLLVFCSVRLLLLLVNFAHIRSERVAPQDGIRAIYRRSLPVLFFSKHSRIPSSYGSASDSWRVTRLQALASLAGAHLRLLGAFATFLTSHQGISAVFCTLGFAVVILNFTIQDDMKAVFDIGDKPKDAALLSTSDFVSQLLDGGMAALEYRVSSLRDLMAFSLLIAFATLLKHLERLPVLGPKLCAITAVLCDSVVIVFVAFIFLVSAAYAMASFVGYSLDTSDRNDVVNSRLETFFMLAFNQILNIDTQTAFAFTRHGFVPDSSIGSAGLYYVVTAVIGNLILSNLIVTVIGERYTLALDANRSSQWGVELNRHLARKRVMLKLQADCIAKLRAKRRFWRTVDPAKFRFAMLMWATLFEDGWKPYGLRLYPWGEEKGGGKGELQILYESVEIERLQGVAEDSL